MKDTLIRTMEAVPGLTQINLNLTDSPNVLILGFIGGRMQALEFVTELRNSDIFRDTPMEASLSTIKMTFKHWGERQNFIRSLKYASIEAHVLIKEPLNFGSMKFDPYLDTMQFVCQNYLKLLKDILAETVYFSMDDSDMTFKVGVTEDAVFESSNFKNRVMVRSDINVRHNGGYPYLSIKVRDLNYKEHFVELLTTYGYNPIAEQPDNI